MPTDKRASTPVRVPKRDLERAERLVAAVSRDPEVLAIAGEVTVATVVRMAMHRGLAALEEQYGGNDGA